LSKSLLGSKAGAGGLASLLRAGFSVLGGDCFGGDVEMIYKQKLIYNVSKSLQTIRKRNIYIHMTGKLQDKTMFLLITSVYDVP